MRPSFSLAILASGSVGEAHSAFDSRLPLRLRSSRTRSSAVGVAIPLWYPLGADGEPDHDHPILPDEASLPIDPSSDVPPGYTQDQRGAPGGFLGDADITAWNPVAERIAPDPGVRAFHDGRYAAYRELYAATRDVVHALAAEDRPHP